MLEKHQTYWGITGRRASERTGKTGTVIVTSSDLVRLVRKSLTEIAALFPEFLLTSVKFQL